MDIFCKRMNVDKNVPLENGKILKQIYVKTVLETVKNASHLEIYALIAEIVSI